MLQLIVTAPSCSQLQWERTHRRRSASLFWAPELQLRQTDLGQPRWLKQAIKSSCLMQVEACRSGSPRLGSRGAVGCVVYYSLPFRPHERHSRSVAHGLVAGRRRANAAVPRDRANWREGTHGQSRTCLRG